MHINAKVYSLLGPQHHLLPLAMAGHTALFAMFADILFLPFDRLELFTFDLARLLHSLGKMPMSFDSPNFRHVRVSADQGLVIFELLSLSCRFNSTAARGVDSP